MQLSELKERIKKGNVLGVYVFAGEEDYLKRHYLGEFRRILVSDEASAPFSHFVFEGASFDLEKMSDAVSTPSFFGGDKLIEWHNADFDRLGEKDITALEAFAESVKQSADSAVVFFVTPDAMDLGTERRPSKLAARLSKFLELVDFQKSGDGALASWIHRHFSAEEISVPASLPAAMIERVGHSMDILASEIDKLICYAKANGLSAVGEREMDFVCLHMLRYERANWLHSYHPLCKHLFQEEQNGRIYELLRMG